MLLVVFGIALINQPLLEEGLQRTVRGLFVSFAYLAVVFYWGISVLDCIREKRSRRIMFAIVGMLLFWLLIRACKYEIWDDTLDIALWYLFYVPQTLLPLLVFHMTLYIEGNHKPGRERWLYLLSGIIILGILTNNLHQLAFRFKGPVSSKSGAYTYGVLYYVSLIWMILFMMAAMINATAKSRILYKKRVFTILSVWLMVPALYLIYYQLGPFFLRTYLFNFPEGCCLIYIIFLEICIQSGMIISNRQHDEIFENSSIMAEITDKEGNTVHRSRMCAALSKEEKRQALAGSMLIQEAYELRAVPLKGGFLYWLKDVRESLKINRILEEAGEELAEENSLLEAEIAAKEKQTALEEQNRIYDSVNEALSDKRRQLVDALEEKGQIYYALVLAAYMKRKGNLVILSRQNENSDIRELGLCINESFSYMSLKGCICSCTVSGGGVVRTESLSLFYDVFEEFLEQIFAQVTDFLCYIRCGEEGITMRCQAECSPDAEPKEDALRVLLKDSNIQLTLEKQDSALYLSCREKVAAYE